MPRKQTSSLIKTSSKQQSNEKKAKKSKESKDNKERKSPKLKRKSSIITISKKTLERLEESFSTEEINELKEIVNSPRQNQKMKMLDEIEMKKITSSLHYSHSNHFNQRKSKQNSKESVQKRKSLN